MNKKKSAKRKSKYRDYNYSGLSGHKRDGTKLRPPFMQMGKVQMSSWADDHLPPMLWEETLILVVMKVVLRRRMARLYFDDMEAKSC